MMAMPVMMPAVAMTHLGTRAPVTVPVMMAATVDHDGLRACDRRDCHGKRTNRRKS
jgi:hypothetical protein